MIISLVLFFEVTLSVGLFFFYLNFAVDKVASDVSLIPKVGCVITILWHFMGLLADLRKLLRYIYFLFWLSVFCRSNEIWVEIYVLSIKIESQFPLYPTLIIHESGLN